MAENSDGLYFKVGVDTSGLETLEDKARATFEKVVKDAEASGEDMDKALSKAAISMYNEFSEMGDALNSARWKEAKEGLKAMFSFNGDEVRASAERLQALNDEQEAIERVQNAIEGYLDERAKGNSNASILGISTNKEITEAEQTLRKLTVVIGGVETEYDSLRQAIASLKKEQDALAYSGQKDTETYIELTKKLTDLKQLQNELNNDLNTGATASRGLQAYLDIASTATAATGLWQSALVGLGASTESAQEAIAKLQAAQTALNSVMAIQKQYMDRSSGTYAAVQKVLSMLGIAKQKDAAATNAQTAAQNANTVAMKAAKGAAIGLRGAMMAIGIGLITSAIAFLIEKWDDLVEGFKDFVGISGDTSDTFDKISAVMQGIGSAVVNYVLTPLKTMVAVVRNLMKGEFKKAFEEGLATAKEGLNVMANYNDAYNKKMLKNAEEHARERAKIAEKNMQIEIDANEAKYGNDWKYTKAGNKAYMEMLDNRIKMYKKDTEEYREAVNDKMRYDREYSKHHEEETAKIKAEYEKQAKARKDAQASYSKELEEVEYNAEMAIQQARIDAMEEGLEKSLAQLKLNNEKWLHAHEKAIKDRAEKIKAYELSQGKKEQDAVYYTEQARTQLKASDVEQLQNSKQVKQQQEVLNKMLADYQTYQEARLKLADEYNKKEGDLIFASNVNGDSSDVMDARMAEFDKQRQEAQDKLDVEFAMKEEEFVNWAESLADLGIAKIEEALALAEAELANIPIEQQTAQQRAIVVLLRKEYKKLKTEIDKTDVSEATKTALERLDAQKKRLESVSKAVNIASDAVDAFGEDWSEAAKKGLNAAKSIYSTVENLINTLFNLAQSSLQATETTATTTAEAIKQAERSSVILAIIQAALEVAMAMFNLFKHESKVTEVVINQHENEIKAIDALIEKQEELIESRKKYGGSLKEAYADLKRSLELEERTYYNFFKEFARDRENNDKSVAYRLFDRKYEVALEKHSNELEKAFEYDITKSLEKSKDKLGDLFIAIQKMSQDQFRELTATQWWAQLGDEYLGDKLVEYLTSANEVEQRIKGLNDELAESLRGFSKEDLQDDLLSYLSDVNTSIEDIDKSFDDMLKNMIKRFIIDKKLQGEMDKFVNTLDSTLSDESLDASDTALINEARDKLEEIYEEGSKRVKELYDLFGIDFETETDKAQARGIATASQESVDENNARLAAMQSYTFDISDNVRAMANNSSLILNNVVLIQQATETMNDNVKQLRADVSDMKFQGVKVLS